MTLASCDVIMDVTAKFELFLATKTPTAPNKHKPLHIAASIALVQAQRRTATEGNPPQWRVTAAAAAAAATHAETSSRRSRTSSVQASCPIRNTPVREESDNNTSATSDSLGDKDTREDAACSRRNRRTLEKRQLLQQRDMRLLANLVPRPVKLVISHGSATPSICRPHRSPTWDAPTCLGQCTRTCTTYLL